MYVNVAYSVKQKIPIWRICLVPLQINNCGYYRVHTGPIIATEHPEGGNDYHYYILQQAKVISILMMKP